MRARFHKMATNFGKYCVECQELLPAKRQASNCISCANKASTATKMWRSTAFKKVSHSQGTVKMDADDYKELLDHLGDIKSNLDKIQAYRNMVPTPPTKPMGQLKLFRVVIGSTQAPDSKYRKDGSLRKFALGGTIYALGVDEESLIATLRSNMLREVDPDRIATGELQGPFAHGNVINYRENK